MRRWDYRGAATVEGWGVGKVRAIIVEVGRLKEELVK